MNFDRRILAIAQGLTVLTPVLMLAGPAPLDIAAALVGALFLLHATLVRDGQWLRQRWVQLVLVLWLAMCLRNLFTDDPLAQLGRSLVWIRYPLFAIALGYWVLRDDATQRCLWLMLAASVVFLILDAFWQYATGTDITGRPAQYLYDGAVRLTGPFSNPRVGITIVWLFFPLLLPLLQDVAWRSRLFACALLVGGLLAVYLSGERTALLLFLLGLLVCGLGYKPFRRFGLLCGLLVAMAAALLTWKDRTLLTRHVDRTWQELQHFGDSSYGRTWGAAWHIWQAHPLFGVGSKGFQKECKAPDYGATDATSLEQRCPMHAHNIYLEWLVEFGLLGTLLFVTLIATWFRDRPRVVTPLVLGLGITLLLRFWPVSVTPSQFVAWSAVPFWLVLGWWYALGPKR